MNRFKWPSSWFSIRTTLTRFSAILLNGVRSLDTLLRSVTKISRSASAVQESEGSDRQSSDELRFAIVPMLITLCILAMFYGLCMGVFALTKSWNADVGSASDRWLQVIASMVKVPSLFALTTLITFPSLYVFSALIGVRLSFTEFVRVVTILLAINLAVLASLGPVVAFFSVSTINYQFMQLFNVVMFAVAGGLGLTWMLGLVSDLAMPTVPDHLSTVAVNASAQVQTSVDIPAEDNSQSPDGDADKQPLQQVPQVPYGRFVSLKWLFRFWVLAFGLVGSQMGWVLRPFIGNPDMAFTWFRERDSNFFEAILVIFSRLLGG